MSKPCCKTTTPFKFNVSLLIVNVLLVPSYSIDEIFVSFPKFNLLASNLLNPPSGTVIFIELGSRYNAFSSISVNSILPTAVLPSFKTVCKGTDTFNSLICFASCVILLFNI